MSLTNKELVAAIAVKTGLSKKDTKDFLQGLKEVVKETTGKGEEVVLHKLVTFKIVDVKARSGNLGGNAWSRPAGKRVTAKVSSNLKQ
jgi:nucleoid DNA-binding protein